MLYDARAKSVNNHLCVLRKLLNLAVEWGELSDAPRALYAHLSPDVKRDAVRLLDDVPSPPLPRRSPRARENLRSP